MKYKQYLIASLKLILVIVLFFASSYLQWIPMKLFHITKVTGATATLLTLFSDTILMLVLIIIYRKDLKKEWQLFKGQFMPNLDKGFKYWFLGLTIMFATNLLIMIFSPVKQANNEAAVQTLIQAAPWFMLITAGFLAPFIEEITFRKTFHDLISNKWIFALVSGLVFGALHVISSATNPYDYLYIISYGALGFFFARSYSETGSVFTSISIHMFHNTILTLFSIVQLYLK